MRLHALLALLLSSVSSVHSILADEAYHVDYHQALLGIPQVATTFFHQPSASSSASLLYTISDKAILGAINPKDGSLLWRQPLAGPLPKPRLKIEDVIELSAEEQLNTLRDASPAEAGLLAEDGTGFVISYYGSTVSTWDATNGKLIWQRIMPQGQHVKSAVLVHSPRETSPVPAIDVVVLYGVHAGTISKLDGSSGALKWEHIDSR
jgi:ER membrane protein complex subunit 1